MLQPSGWTTPRDGRLRRLRAEGATWEAIGEELGVSADVVRERGRRIGARRPPPDHVPVPDLDRPPLAPGSALSWAVLTDGTLLHGTTCVWPPPEGCDEDEETAP